MFWKVLKVMLATFWIIPVLLAFLAGTAVINYFLNKRESLAGDRKQEPTTPTPASDVQKA